MAQYLVTGGEDDPLLPQLLTEIERATEIDLAVAFIKSSGLQLLYQALSDACTRETSPAKLRILTSDYLDVTDPQALRMLLFLQERGAEVRVFQAGNDSFHLKAYIFVRTEDGARSMHGNAFVGSSNISKKALTDGLEWNYRVVLPNKADDDHTKRFEEIRQQYQRLFDSPQAVALEHSWIEAYEQRRKVVRLPVAPGSDDPELPKPEPTDVQQEALSALANTRAEGFQRGLVVMATGLGKTYLAAFDAEQMNAGRVLFVAHREEILLQAEQTFQRIRPKARVGQYMGAIRDEQVDLLFASVLTLGKEQHLQNFSPTHFDYIVVDEFHHAAANTYRTLLTHFKPKFLLGLTATPERTDQSDILSFCDDNLVYGCDLFEGIERDLLCPFTYYGIYDEHVNYEEIPWRSGRFEPDSLSNKLATLARARHAYREWKEKSQERTLAFCVSRKHADFMAQRFSQEGVRAAAAYQGSDLTRSEALAQLESGQLQVVFSVDLFSEGVDLPAIDTVMMLRPTESKILFLQQLGRGLRKHPGKERLCVLDFIGNHRAFLHKPQALFKIAGTYRALAGFARKLEQAQLELPPGCYANYDLEIINFLKQLDSDGIEKDYEALKQTLGRRPTLVELYRAGSSMQQLRRLHGHWWGLVAEQNDLDADEARCLERYADFYREVEITPMTKSFKMVLLEALLENDGINNPPSIETLAEQSREVFRRRRSLIPDLQENLQDIDNADNSAWLDYWKRNPINAWTGGNRTAEEKAWFQIQDSKFVSAFEVEANDVATFESMLQELIDYRFASYQARASSQSESGGPDTLPPTEGYELPYFPNIKIACGHFRSGRADVEEYRTLGPGHGQLDPNRHFIARAVGNSMDGGKSPVKDGDYLLLELLGSNHAGSITGSTMAIERQDAGGDDQYLLRNVTKTPDGHYILKAANPDYEDVVADDSMRTLAKLKEVLDPLELAIGQEFMREEIPVLFGEAYNPGNWQAGHVVLPNANAHVLLVTLNKQGKGADHRYHDYFIDDHTFHWQSQNQTTPESKRGRELINHQQSGVDIHLFVREHKMAGRTAAPFRYYGPVIYQSHKGSAPMSVTFKLGAN